MLDRNNIYYFEVFFIGQDTFFSQAFLKNYSRTYFFNKKIDVCVNKAMFAYNKSKEHFSFSYSRKSKFFFCSLSSFLYFYYNVFVFNFMSSSFFFFKCYVIVTPKKTF